MQPEWTPGTDWTTLPACPHFENTLELQRDYPDGSTRPFIYKGHNYQGFPSGGENNVYQFVICNGDFSQYSLINGTYRNFVVDLPTIAPYTPTNGSRYEWIGFPYQNEFPFYGEPPVHTELETRRIILADLSGDPFPYYKWIAFNSDGFSGEVYLYWPQDLTPGLLCLFFYPRPNIRIYQRHVLAVGGSVVAPVVLLGAIAIAMFSGGAVPTVVARRRRKKA